MVVAVSAVKSARIKPGLHKSRILGDDERFSPLIKVPETLSVSSSRHGPSIIGDPEYNMVSLDAHHVGYIAANRIYYHRIPHQRMVLRLEDIRETNGLPRHLLESVRPFFPFFVDY